jgi:hypothetical protein
MIVLHLRPVKGDVFWCPGCRRAVAQANGDDRRCVEESAAVKKYNGSPDWSIAL